MKICFKIFPFLYEKTNYRINFPSLGQKGDLFVAHKICSLYFIPKKLSLVQEIMLLYLNSTPPFPNQSLFCFLTRNNHAREAESRVICTRAWRKNKCQNFKGYTAAAAPTRNEWLRKGHVVSTPFPASCFYLHHNYFIFQKWHLKLIQIFKGQVTILLPQNNFTLFFVHLT